MDTDALNNKLAQWRFGTASTVHPFHCGFISNRIIITVGKKKNEQTLYAGEKFTESLDACFKWLVPKLNSFVCPYQTNLKNIRDGWHVMLYGLTDSPYLPKRLEAEAETPSLALCLAIEKLVDSV